MIFERLDLRHQPHALLAGGQARLLFQRGDFGLNFFGAFIPNFFLRGGRERNVVLLRRREVGLQPVVIALQNRIELVVVTTRAADRQPEKRRADNVRALGEHLVATERDLGIARVAPHRAEAVKN